MLAPASSSCSQCSQGCAAPSRSQPRSLVITLLAVGAIVLLTMLIAHFAGAHVNVLISLGAISGVFIALIIYVARSRPPKDIYETLYEQNHIKPEDFIEEPFGGAQTMQFLNPLKGFGNLSWFGAAILAGRKDRVSQFAHIFVGRAREKAKDAKYAAPTSDQIRDGVQGLTPLQLVGHYLMIHWNTQPNKNKLILSAKNMLCILGRIQIKDP